MADEDSKPACKYGTNCYQRNQPHKDRFSHPPKDNLTDLNNLSLSPPQPPKKRKMKTTNQNISSDEDEIEKSENGGEQEDADSTVQKSTELKITSDESASARCFEFIGESFDKGPHAQRVEHQKLLEKPARFISEKFLVEMPNDFFVFWEFCKVKSSDNCAPENVFSKFGLKLVGPFDVLSQRFDEVNPFEPGDYLRHWRFYYDPPQFQVNFSIIYNYFNSEINYWFIHNCGRQFW